MTDDRPAELHDHAEGHRDLPTLGERLDAIARARMRSVAPQPVWTVPLLRAIERCAQVGDVLGDRFERTETMVRDDAPPPAELAEQLALARTSTGWQHDPDGARRETQPADRAAARTPAAPTADEPGEHGPEGERHALPADVASRLRREVGPAADLMRVHDGPHADAFARAADADAVTVGRDVHLRRGRWAPRTEEGLALLTHEATHVAALVDPGVAWQRALGEHAEEALALSRERSVLGTRDPSPPGAAGLAAAATIPVRGQAISTAPTAPAAPAAHAGAADHGAGPARRAGTERDLGAATVPDLESLRRAVLADVMSQLRSEIERGA